MHRVPVVLSLLLALVVAAVPAAVGASSDVVVSQLYAGGGNSGATYTNDFVELFNPGSTSVDLSSWTIQYASTAGTSWQPTPLTGSIGPGHYYLVQLGSTAATRAAAGCTDTGDNAADFDALAPQPRNSAAATTTCGGSPPPSGSASQGAQVDVDVQPLLSISLERSSLSFGQVRTGTTPSPLSEAITVVGNTAAGYSLSVHRSAFTPADLPLGIASTAPAGGQLGPALAGGARPAVPITPAADLLVGTTTAASAAAGDVWPATLGFTAPLPSVPAGRYSAGITFTVIAR